MARKLRVQFEGAIYHVTIRGVDRRRIFDDDADRDRFLLKLGEAAEACGVRLYLFCLMTNHVHLLAETPHANLSVFMHKLQTAYTVYYNLRHRRSGHLMQGRFDAILVQGDEYLLKLSRYIHLNPVFIRAQKTKMQEKRVKALREYPWSSYRGYAGLGIPLDFVTEGPILATLGGSKKRQRKAYRRFVEAGIAETDEDFNEVLKSMTWGIGDSDFQDQIRDMHTDLASSARRPEDVSFRKVEALQNPAEVIRLVANAFNLPVESLQIRQYGCVARAVAAVLLGRHAGMNQRDIGAYLGMGTGSAVCRQLRRFRERMAVDKELAAMVGEMAEVLKR